ncbi:hypothetical protein [Pedobacter nyackensis]|uniref:Uncharacterized protein n=1 Tax=Pedobacter nyackensis TaxID=475255 RepID=A0A1W2EFZ6_9SPHI|nr:hypothetical protein [Pedobacter nyackensis]SMD08670.1 hypothetical protein SAMN04488101_11253 [Pedobacter nyackensis]
MQYDFSQHTLLEKKQFRFIEDGLSIRQSSIGKIHEYELKYENVGTKITHWKNGQKIFLVVAAFLTFVSFVLYFDRQNGGQVDPFMQLFILILISLLVFLYFFTFKTACYLTSAGNPNPIEFFSNKPDKETVDKFIDEILSRRRQFLLQRHGQLNKNLSYEPQYYNLIWLLDNNVINQVEYEKKLKELNTLFTSTPTIKGFSIKND